MCDDSFIGSVHFSFTKVWRVNADPAGTDGASPEEDGTKQFHSLI